VPSVLPGIQDLISQELPTRAKGHKEKSEKKENEQEV